MRATGSKGLEPARIAAIVWKTSAWSTAMSSITVSVCPDYEFVTEHPSMRTAKVSKTKCLLGWHIGEFQRICDCFIRYPPLVNI